MISQVSNPGQSRPIRQGPFVLAIALGIGVLILYRRNLYEDEWTTLSILTRPYREIIEWCLTVDVHPPGVYLIDRWLSGLGFEGRALGLAHLATWTVGAWSFASTFSLLLVSQWGRTVLAMIVLLHPHVLTWNTSLRWCSFWWGIALLATSLALGPVRRTSKPGWAASLGVGAMLGVLVHLDYLALGFGPSLAVAWLVRWGVSRASVWRLAVIGLTALVIAAPLAIPLSKIVAAGGPPQMDPPRLAVLRMGHVLSIGEPILPWHPLAALVIGGLLVPSGLLAFRRASGAATRVEPADLTRAGRRVLLALTALLFLMAMGILAGFGNRGYTSLGLTPIIALWMAYGLDVIESMRWRGVVSALLLAWIGIGGCHLAFREGNAKRQFNDKPEHIISELQRVSEGRPAVVVTDDAVLTFENNALRNRDATSLVTCSAIADDVHGYPAGTGANMGNYPFVIVLDHPEGSWNAMGHVARIGLDQAKRLLAEPRELVLAEDPDWELKNRLTDAGLSSGRLRATYGRPLPGDWESVNQKIREASELSILGPGRAEHGR